ncbi:hypothetical protein AB0F43_29820 [Kribbella sp. NPDC023972]|uniref:hypothetical protein n=1 Tax=Kribbella sp. NPDC023972 TaxID=3154795 RepID=UPI00340A12E6
MSVVDGGARTAEAQLRHGRHLGDTHDGATPVPFERLLAEPARGLVADRERAVEPPPGDRYVRAGVPQPAGQLNASGHLPVGLARVAPLQVCGGRTEAGIELLLVRQRQREHLVGERQAFLRGAGCAPQCQRSKAYNVGEQIGIADRSGCLHRAPPDRVGLV